MIAGMNAARNARRRRERQERAAAEKKKAAAEKKKRLLSRLSEAGLRVGDVVYSKINHSHNGKSIEPGDPGTVEDPDECTDPEKRVLVKFENGMRVNMFFKQVVSARGAAAGRAVLAAALSEGKKAEKAEKGPMATLEKLQKMVEKGLITQADYDKKKDQILAAM